MRILKRRRVTAELLGGPLCGYTLRVPVLPDGLPTPVFNEAGTYHLIDTLRPWMAHAPTRATYAWEGLANGPNQQPEPAQVA